MEKADIRNYIILPLFVGVILYGFVIAHDWYNNYQETKQEINYHFDLANQSYEDNQFEDAIGEYKKVTELAFQKFPSEYALAQCKLGNSYSMLAEISDKETNCNNAINSFQKALEIYTIEKDPTNYAGTQINLGNAYGRLAEVRDKETNCENSINAYNKSLEVFTVEKYPLEYALAQRNLGLTSNIST